MDQVYLEALILTVKYWSGVFIVILLVLAGMKYAYRMTVIFLFGFGMTLLLMFSYFTALRAVEDDAPIIQAIGD